MKQFVFLVNNLKKSAGPTVTRNKLPIKTEEEEKYMKDNQTLQLQVKSKFLVTFFSCNLHVQRTL